MNNKYSYQCPDCGNIIKYKDKFCKECGCKIDWEEEENIIDSDNINDSNENYIVSKKSDFERKQKEENTQENNINKNKKTKLLKIIICVIICIVLVSAVIVLIYNLTNRVDKSENDINSSIGNETNTENKNTKKIGKEQFEEMKAAKEKEAKEIWGYKQEVHANSGNIYELLDEFVVTENHAYRFSQIGTALDFYEVNFFRTGDKVNISYDYNGEKITFNGIINSDKLILYMQDGTTIYGEYPRIFK